MKITIVDGRGELCPKPLIMTRNALREAGDNAAIDVLLDNDTARCNVERFLADHKIAFSTREEGAVFRVLIRASGVQASVGAPPQVVARPLKAASRGGEEYIVSFRTNRMGEGPEELGAILVQALVNTLGDADVPPQKVVMYNSGVLLAADNSPALAGLKALEAKGVEILVCGTCVNYFSLKDKLGVGKISNMLDILTALSSGSRVVVP
jgi:selenium metabolism protein YedF